MACHKYLSISVSADFSQVPDKITFNCSAKESLKFRIARQVLKKILIFPLIFFFLYVLNAACYEQTTLNVCFFRSSSLVSTKELCIPTEIHFKYLQYLHFFFLTEY